MFSRLMLMAALITPTILAAQVKEIKTITEYEKYFKDEKPLIILYSGEFCPPCKLLKPLFKKAALVYADIRFCAVDADTNNKSLLDHMDALKINGIPTLICSCKGTIMLRHTGGLSKKELELKIEKFYTELKKAPTKKAPKVKQAPTQNKKTPQKKMQAS